MKGRVLLREPEGGRPNRVQVLALDKPTNPGRSILESADGGMDLESGLCWSLGFAEVSDFRTGM